jgi:hypothetical protein
MDINVKVPVSISVSLGNATVSREYEVIDAGNAVWIRNTVNANSKSNISNAEIKDYFRNKLIDEINDIFMKAKI